MRILTTEESHYVETLQTVAGEITQRIISSADANGQPKYAHLFEMWKAFLGGFVCRELGEYIDLDDSQREMLNEYTPEAIEKLITKTVEVKVEVPVEKVVEKIVEKRVEIPVTTAASSGAATVITGTKERRRFHQRARHTEKNRDLLPSERVYMINKFNELQRLIDKDSSEARTFTNALNDTATQNGYKTIFPSQLAGYWSVLCKRVCGIDGNVPTYIAGAIKYGKLPDNTPVPEATDEFKKAILENLMENKSEQAKVAEYQAIYRNLLRNNPSLNTPSV